MIYCVSDIHGNLKAWENIKRKINLNPSDDLYVLGDVIDRHPYGIQILQEIMHTKNMHMILGNHEYMMMAALGFPYDDKQEDLKLAKSLWFYNGGEVTYKAWQKLTDAEKEEIKYYLLNLPLNRNISINGENIILCHAATEKIAEKITERDNVPFFCVWDRDYIGINVGLDETIIMGHTPTIQLDSKRNELKGSGKFNSVVKMLNFYAIDCAAGWPDNAIYDGKRGRLSCIRLDDKKVWYSRS